MQTVGTREYGVDEVLAHATTERGVNLVYEGFRVRMDSLRYQVFLRSRRCAKCGLEGTVFLLQRSPGDPPDRAHFNLYAHAPNGDLVLMTKDHIVPQSKGGKHNAENLQTLCSTCNGAKADR
jgi:5-methylcytosine-specific restriction endonuclease McrA